MNKFNILSKKSAFFKGKIGYYVEFDSNSNINNWEFKSYEEAQFVASAYIFYMLLHKKFSYSEFVSIIKMSLRMFQPSSDVSSWYE